MYPTFHGSLQRDVGQEIHAEYSSGRIDALKETAAHMPSGVIGAVNLHGT